MSRHEIYVATADNGRASTGDSTCGQVRQRSFATTEKFMSRRSLHFCRDRVFPTSYCDKKFPIATEKAWPHVATVRACRDRAWVLGRPSLSRQSASSARQRALSAHDNAQQRARQSTLVRNRAHCAYDQPATVHCVVHYLATVHGHCKKKRVQK